MTQISNLPQFDGAQSVFTVVKNAGWYDTILFCAPGSPPLQTGVGALTAGSTTLSALSGAALAAIVPGQAVTGFGIPPGTTVAAIPSATSLTLSNPATATDVLASLSIQPIPLDISGIAFEAQVRNSADQPGVLLDLSTASGSLVNGGPTGQLAFNVAPAALSGLAAKTYVTDLVATADGRTLNLFQTNGPASVIVRQGVTR